METRLRGTMKPTAKGRRDSTTSEMEEKLKDAKSLNQRFRKTLRDKDSELQVRNSLLPFRLRATHWGINCRRWCSDWVPKPMNRRQVSRLRDWLHPCRSLPRWGERVCNLPRSLLRMNEKESRFLMIKLILSSARHFYCFIFLYSMPSNLKYI